MRLEHRLLIVALATICQMPGHSSADRSSVRDVPVRVWVTRVAHGAHTDYRYRVENASAFPITSVHIGWDYVHDRVELGMPPFRPAPADTASPRGWHFEMEPTEEDSLGSIAWEVDTPANALVGGRELQGFSVGVPADSLYECGSWVVFLNSAQQVYFTGTLRADLASTRRGAARRQPK